MFPSVGALPVVVSAFVAGGALGLYMGWLYGKAIGSPLGNVLVALMTPMVVPAIVYAVPFQQIIVPDDVREPFEVFLVVLLELIWDAHGPAPWSNPELFAGAALVGLIAALWTIRRSYLGIEDIPTWEREVLPDGFRMVDNEWLTAQPSAGAGRSTEVPRLRPRAQAQVELRLGTFAVVDVLWFVFVVIGLSQLAVWVFADRTFYGPMLLILLATLHRSLSADVGDGVQ